MSILIKGVSMPKTCEDCPCFDEGFYYCNVKKENLSERLFDHTKDPPPNWCPLIEIPDVYIDIAKAFMTELTDKVCIKGDTEGIIY